MFVQAPVSQLARPKAQLVRYHGLSAVLPDNESYSAGVHSQLEPYHLGRLNHIPIALYADRGALATTTSRMNHHATTCLTLTVAPQPKR
jgi:hypothetical protein